MTSKTFSKDFASLGKKAKLDFIVTPRGCRSGFAIQVFFRSIYYIGGITAQVIDDVCRQGF
jgi:hypothetical protein